MSSLHLKDPDVLNCLYIYVLVHIVRFPLMFVLLLEMLILSPEHVGNAIAFDQ